MTSFIEWNSSSDGGFTQLATPPDDLEVGVPASGTAYGQGSYGDGVYGGGNTIVGIGTNEWVESTSLWELCEHCSICYVDAFRQCGLIGPADWRTAFFDLPHKAFHDGVPMSQYSQFADG